MPTLSPQFTIYAHTKEAWGGMYTACQKAEKSIYIEMYIVVDTKDTYDFISLFCEKAKQGVNVVLLLDAWGSRKLSSRDRLELRNAGVEIRFFIKWFSFIHRKLVIVDDTVVFVGGVNLQPKAVAWFDLVIKITHGPTMQFKKMFARTYQMTKGEDSHILAFLLHPDRETLGLQIIDHLPILRYFKLRSYVTAKLNVAQTRVVFATPYLVPPTWFSEIIQDLLRRGVEVVFLLPSWTDSIIIRRINPYYATKYSKLGAKIYISQSMNHAKAMLVDNKEGMIGSGNIDNLSFGINSEIGVFFDDEHAVAHLERIFDTWQEESILYTPDEHGLKWYHKLLLPILWMLKPVL
jgi:cardiolipin synthase